MTRDAGAVKVEPPGLLTGEASVEGAPNGKLRRCNLHTTAEVRANQWPNSSMASCFPAPQQAGLRRQPRCNP